jgi:hypothetical protein
MVSYAHVPGVVEHMRSGKGNLGKGRPGSILIVMLAEMTVLIYLAPNGLKVQASVPLKKIKA